MVLRVPSIGVAKSLLVGRVVRYKEGIERLMYDLRVVGFATGHGRARRHWSPGFSISLDELERIILIYGDTCLTSLNRADLLSRDMVQELR